MTEQPLKPVPPLSVEDGTNVTFRRAQEALCHGYQECKQHVRKAPCTSVFFAAAAGYCLHRMPVRAIVVAQVRLLSALAPPTLLLLGLAKFREILKSQAAEKPDLEDRHHRSS